MHILRHFNSTDPADPAEREALLVLWLRSVRATHDFLTEDDRAFYHPLVGEFLNTCPEIWAVYDKAAERPLGFMILDEMQCLAKIEALFVDPAYARQGIGSLLVRHAQAAKRPLTLDVNEQNPGAHAFYLRMGFTEIGRSAVDSMGKPFPLIHMVCFTSAGG